MRTRILLGLFCLSLVVTACARQKKTVKTNSSTSTAAGNSTSTSKAGRDITAMTMRRGGCFGRCPIYQVNLFSDGRVEYIGEMFAPSLGTFEKNVGASKVQTLFREAQALRIDTCSEEYEMMIADLPGLSFTVSRPQGVQSIRNASFGPRYLVSLAADMDSLAQVDKTWRKTAEVKKRD